MKSDSYYLAELEDKLLDTVYSYVNNVPRPFGLLLSGGFDSGLLAALTKPDYVYTVRFPYGVTYDESRYADAIIKHLGLTAKTNIIIPKKEDFEKYFEEAVKVMGEPVSHFSLVPFFIMMKFIANRDKSSTMHVLSGEGPDEYLGGYARQIIFDELAKLYSIPELRGYKNLVDKVVGNILSAKYYGNLIGYDSKKVSDWILDNQDLFEKNKVHEAIGRMDMELGVIEKMEQKLATACGVKLHYPYINEEFAEYCYQLPDHLKVRNGVTKWAFREICKKYLPEFVWDRSKMGGPVAPVNDWLGIGGGFDKTEYLKRQKEILK